MIESDESKARTRERVDRRLSNTERVAEGGRGAGPGFVSLNDLSGAAVSVFSDFLGEGTKVDAEFCFSSLLSECSE